MKKMLLGLMRWPCLLQDVLNRRLLFKTKLAAVAPKETITHHFFVSGIGQKKTVDAAKICGGAENVVKTENPANIRKWIARFYYFRHLYPLEARVLLSIIIRRVAHRYGQLYLHCSLIYFWVPSSCFCIVISLSSEGEIIPFSGVCQSGGCIIHAGGGGGRAPTDRLLYANRRRPAATSSRRASFSALASANSFVYFASSAATSR